LHAPALAPTLLAVLRASATASVTVAESSPNPQQNMVHLTFVFFASWRCVKVAFEGAVMRIIVLAAVLAASCALGGCFHFHTSQVYSAPQALPPLK
jgi:hypothetical protein